jgi:CheY-like chemotaxis protein
LVEDNPGDQLLAKKLFEAANLTVHVTTVDDGEKAMEFVDKWSSSNRPDLVLLDLNLPKRSGHEVLDHIRGKDLKVPVAVFAGSSSNDDLERAKQLGAVEYIVKPMGMKEFDATVPRLRQLAESLSNAR